MGSISEWFLLGGKDRRAPPGWAMWPLVRLVPQMRSRIKECVEAVRSDKAGSYIERWYSEWKPNRIARISEMRDVDLERLSDEELEQHIGAVIAFIDDCSYIIHVLLNGGLMLMLGDLAFTCRACSCGMTSRRLSSSLACRRHPVSRHIAWPSWPGRPGSGPKYGVCWRVWTMTRSPVCRQ